MLRLFSLLCVSCFSLTDNNKAPLQRSRSRQNINVGSAVVKAPPAKEAHNKSESHSSAAAQAKLTAGTETGRRYRNTPGHTYGLDRERVVERQTLKPMEKGIVVEAEPLGLQQPSSGAPVSSCCTNGESDVEALLAKLRAL